MSLKYIKYIKNVIDDHDTEHTYIFERIVDTNIVKETTIIIIIIIVTSFAPISSKIKLSGATKPGD